MGAMGDISVQFLGSGDAFGSGGRLQACIHLCAPSVNVLIDCGATGLIGMKRYGVDPNCIDAILLSHLHGDHYGGIPFFILDAHLISRRTRPLTIAGPPGLEKRILAAEEIFFPGSTGIQLRFPINYVELPEYTQTSVCTLPVKVYPVVHASGSPSYALKIEYGGKVLAYSGDTEWTDALVDVAQGADLLICEAYFFEKRTRYHLDYKSLMSHLAQLNCRRVIVTHMNSDLLGRSPEIELDCAEDGMKVFL